MKKNSYFEKLKDPRWQKKRLEVMERSDFMCENCKNTGKTLNVHHGYYESGYAPWEYNSDTLWCLCEDCHKDIKNKLRDLHYQLSKVHPVRYAQVMKYLAKYRAPKH